MPDIAGQIFEQLIVDLYDRPIMGNQYRPDFVERMVFLGLASGFRLASANWVGWDIEGPEDLRIEVKQSAAHQPWSTEDKGPAKGNFDIAPRQGYYVDDGASWVPKQGRPAHIYILAWHPVFGHGRADHRNPEQWTFFVVPSGDLPPAQKSISATVVARRWRQVSFGGLRDAVLSAKRGQVSQPLEIRRD